MEEVRYVFHLEHILLSTGLPLSSNITIKGDNKNTTRLKTMNCAKSVNAIFIGVNFQTDYN